jgi:hypothetical protein
MEYTVAYEIQLDAGSPEEAAEKLARHLEHDGYAARGVYDVTDSAGVLTQIDLSLDEDDEPAEPEDECGDVPYQGRRCNRRKGHGGAWHMVLRADGTGVQARWSRHD